MDFEQIATELTDRVLTITLNRPERLNAWTAQMGSELRAAFDRADADDEVRAVIVTGAGRGFCAGADLESGGDTFDYRIIDHVVSPVLGKGDVYTVMGKELPVPPLPSSPCEPRPQA